jgi:molybdenum cofactor biosynthesis enzyme MoaA
LPTDRLADARGVDEAISVIIFGAGLVGEATLHACRAKGMPVDFFVDDRMTGAVMGVNIISTVQRAELVGGKVEIYLTSPNIEDMITPLEILGFDNWKSCGEVLKDFDLSSADFSRGRNTQYSIEHIKYLVRTCLHHHDNYLHPEKLSVQSVDLMITEKCSMKCRDCSNLMQYYEHPENADIEQMYQMIDGLCGKMDEIYEFRVIGGEPFMHKDLHTVVAYVCGKPNVVKVAIFTNATILPREHQWEAFQHEKVRLFITDYDALSRNIKPLVAELEKRGIAFVNEKANNWTDCASLEKHDRTVAENEALFAQCCAKNLATLADGRLYRCPFAANAAKLKAVPDYQEDYLEVADVTREQIRHFLREKTYIETCDHCNGRSYGDKVITPGIQTKRLNYIKWH